MESSVEIAGSAKTAATPLVEIRLLGPVVVRHGGSPVVLARSRKLRALLAILITEPRQVSRQRLCDLLWDRPNDPRAELRWHLSKLRQVLDRPHRLRVLSSEDGIGLDLDGCVVDAVQIMTAEKGEPLSVQRLKTLAELYRGQFLGELSLAEPSAEQWITAQRRRFAACQISILKQLTARRPVGSCDIDQYLEQWLNLAPFEIEPHHRLLSVLASQGRFGEAETHLANSERLFADEGISVVELRKTWSDVKKERGAATRSTNSAGTHQVAVAQVEPCPSAPSRSALAVMPFTVRDPQVGTGIADGLTNDVITRLAKLRNMSIIARGSVYALAARGVSGVEAGKQLNVNYVATASMQRVADKLRVEIDLIDTQSARIVWTETCEAPNADLISALEELGNRIVAALTGEIERAERNRAILRPPTSLDAWEAHHRGLWHMYRFTKENNARAQHFFDAAVTLDPTFSRAYAGLSFTHWQNAFQNWSDPGTEAESAYAAATQSMLADEQDPAAHLAMGRALWLRRQHDLAVKSLRVSVDLSPNFALAHYALAFVEAQTGDPEEAIKASDTSRALSPYDPLMFGMLGSRAMGHLRLGQFEAAAEWATQAAARPNAHINILGMAALFLALADRVPEARILAAVIHAQQPRYGIDSFLAAFHFSPEEAHLLRSLAAKLSLI
ncbi:hypothetical protein [Pseudosulfitobacter pseudonitzschiae]|uniref:hypothetical protein n=1 Tax=Pseudosulfitobacter pseudonitzschiae TaxID=1402135 RepID=UPI001AF671F6|nr:hypothetical protein [Pseudosulfitobacter pseudonitzschiae]MBM1813510.1 hypothetical protein [Pseudosulfitobacter pseudonitzschiae]MBM1830503.1 hypothetical protein [Pseudosulfitobacter pseudonitzschiae]MBM1835370.1 hypothetical protein [Pseudosulfitobacter pseudonitzschiae]MBM1840216.1 hypothetical protein [Pseudosulfitobacter pseudonitzschiae]MBM1845796.1 hypothetical protein [Pseudosulfitobacter pseudonitzschiae]